MGKSYRAYRKGDTMLTVGISESYTTVQSAVDACPVGGTVYVRSGIYRERVEIRKPLTLIGESARDTVITGGLYGYMPCEDGKLGTFRSYTCLVFSDDVVMEHITIENTAGWGKDIGQAVALYAEGDRLRFFDCRILGRQDTLFTGPLPHHEIEKGGFRGPTEHAPRRSVHQYYDRCYIEGDVDFIFGSANARFTDCNICSLDRGQAVNGYVTASSAYEGDGGYVFEGCVFTSDCPDRTVYLGRPWRDHARVTFIDCDMGSHIVPELIHDWDKPSTHDTACYTFIGCRGIDPDVPRLPFVHIITEDDR